MSKKYKNKNLTPIIVVITFFVLFIASIGIQIVGVNYNKQNNNVVGNTNNSPSDDWKSAFEQEELQLAYLGTPSCSWCNKIRPGLDSLKAKYGVDFVYINMSDINTKERSEIFEQLEINENEFGTPYLVVIKNGKKIAEQVGYIPEEELFKFYQNNGLIEKGEEYR